MKTLKKWKVILLVTILLLLAAAGTTQAAVIRLNKTSITLQAGKKTVLCVNGTKKKVTWKSSKKSVATVNSAGVVKGVKAGSAKITAKTSGKTLTCKVKVVKKATSASIASGASKAAAKKTASTSSSAKKTTTTTTSSASNAQTAASSTKLTASVTGMSAEEARVYKILYGKKASYPEGCVWNRQSFYSWKGGIYSGGYGCAGFAFLLSDAAFGSTPARVHKNIGSIRVGDILRVDGDSHSVVVMKIVGSNIVIVEGNCNGAVHWGRVITKSELSRTLNYVMTRY